MRNRRWLLAILGASLWLSGCGHKKPKVEPPAPPMPPGVTWGAPSGSNSTAPVTASSRRGHDANFPYTPVSPDGTALHVGQVFQVGIASFYGPQEQGQPTASGEPFDYHKMTAAHLTLPLGTRVRVTDLKTHRSVVVKVNDRGPFWPHRVLDLSLGAARKIGVYPDGLDPVRIEIVQLPDPLRPGRFTVQVGWFNDGQLLSQCRRLMEEDSHLPVVEFHSSSGRWLRYSHTVSLPRKQGQQIVETLREHHFPAYLVRLN